VERSNGGNARQQAGERVQPFVIQAKLLGPCAVDNLNNVA
jgi:hypothetical protein